MNHWLLWALFSAFFAGLTAILAKIGVTGINSHLATALRTSVVLVFAWAIAWLTSRPWAHHTSAGSSGESPIDSTLGTSFDFASISPKTWLFLTLSGLATGLSWICYFRALQLGEASRVACIDKLSVVMVVALSCLFLGERLGAREGMGVALIVCGALLMAWK